MKTTLLFITAALLTMPAFGRQPCTTTGGQKGFIGYEWQEVPNFKGEMVRILVEYCGYTGGKTFAGYHYALPVRPTFSSNVGATCNGLVCTVPRDGVQQLQQMQTQTLGAAVKLTSSAAPSLSEGGRPLSTALSQALARCPAQGDCQIPSSLLQGLNTHVNASREALQPLPAGAAKAVDRPGLPTK